MCFRYVSAACRVQPCTAGVCRVLLGPYCTAAEKRSSGEDGSYGNDPSDDPGRGASGVRGLEVKACQLEEQVRELTVRYNRAVEESDMVRKRTQKFVEDAKLFGIQSFCRDLVEVADLLEQPTREERQGGADRTTADVGGEEGLLGKVQARLQGVFTKHGLEKMQAVGSRYDPYQHRVVCHTPVSLGVEPCTVAVVKQEGYALHGRTIRHALVGIAVVMQGRDAEGPD